MTDSEKVPYLQCLYHTGKNVYKYWLAALGVAALVTAIGMIVYKLWDGIAEGFNYLMGGAQYISNCIGNAIIYAWVLACTVPWYLWILAGVIVGPFILVAIYCAGKHYNIKSKHVGLIVICITVVGTLCGMFNCFYHIVNSCVTGLDLVICAVSVVWWVVVITDPGQGVYE
jgi:hypothetical protein